MLQAYDPKYKRLHDIIKTKEGTYMLQDQKGSTWGPIGLTKAELVRLCRKAGYQIY